MATGAKMATTARNAENIPEYELERNKAVLESQRKCMEENLKRREALNLTSLARGFNAECQSSQNRKKVA